MTQIPLNISKFKNCYGCGVCASICPRNVIKMEENSSGFYSPTLIDSATCTNCGLCEQVCSYNYTDIAQKSLMNNSYAVWSKDPNIRQKSSSGGVAWELSEAALLQGYKVCAVRYNPITNRAEHYIASSVDELNQSLGSKYIQSFTENTFKLFSRKEKYLVFGTPCQIDSLRRMAKTFKMSENFIFVDFFCHGVPSILLWDKYCSSTIDKTGAIKSVSWRNKNNGWHNSWVISIEGAKATEQKSRNDDDHFYRFFLTDTCLADACYDKCKFKGNLSSADIRIGDFWGNKYQDNELGISAVITLTQKGDQLLRISNCQIENATFADIMEGQMKSSPIRPKENKFVMNLLKSNKSMDQIRRAYERQRNLIRRISYITNPKNLFKRCIR